MFAEEYERSWRDVIAAIVVAQGSPPSRSDEEYANELCQRLGVPQDAASPCRRSVEAGFAARTTAGTSSPLDAFVDEFLSPATARLRLATDTPLPERRPRAGQPPESPVLTQPIFDVDMPVHSPSPEPTWAEDEHAIVPETPLVGDDAPASQRVERGGGHSPPRTRLSPPSVPAAPSPTPRAWAPAPIPASPHGPSVPSPDSETSAPRRVRRQRSPARHTRHLLPLFRAGQARTTCTELVAPLSEAQLQLVARMSALERWRACSPGARPRRQCA